MKHFFMRQILKCEIAVLAVALGWSCGGSSSDKNRADISLACKEDCAFCGADIQSALQQTESIREMYGEKLTRAPGVGLLNIYTGEWIDLQLWDTVTGKRGRSETRFGSVKKGGGLVEFETIKDRGYAEGTIHLTDEADGTTKQLGAEDMAKNTKLCTNCLYQAKDSVCSYVFTDPKHQTLVPLDETHTFFMIGDYAVSLNFSDMPETIDFIVFYAPEDAAFCAGTDWQK